MLVGWTNAPSRYGAFAVRVSMASSRRAQAVAGIASGLPCAAVLSPLGVVLSRSRDIPSFIFLLLVQRIVVYHNQGGALLLALVGFLRLRLVEPSCSVRHAPYVFVLFTMRDPA